MQKPFFTVAIPALNEEKYISFVLENLLTQSFTDFEVWVCDGKSEDNTRTIVKAFAKRDKRIHLCTSPIRNAGAQRNCAARAGTGKYIIFLDADTQIPDYFIEGLHYHLLREKFDVWSCGTFAESTKPKDRLNAFVFNLWAELNVTTNTPAATGASMGSSRKVFNAIDGFDENLSFVEDYDYARRAVKKGYTFTLLKDPEYYFNFRRIHKDGAFTVGMGLLPTVIKIIKKEKILDPIDAYPMLGGSYFDITAKPKKRSLTKHMNVLTAALKRTVKREEKEIRKLLKEALGEF